MRSEPIYVRRPELHKEGFNQGADLPYGLKVAEVRKALDHVYTFIHDLNTFLVGRGYDRLEETILGNSLSGFISELVVRNLGEASSTLARNAKIGGHPDLIPRGKHPGDAVLRGRQGVEVKTSIQSGGWQGHNPEKSWVMVVQYSVDVLTEPVEDRRPMEILKVMVARLQEKDWSFSGRRGSSRRTPTASILKSGTAKLHGNAIYEHPNYIRNLAKMAAQLKELHAPPSALEEPGGSTAATTERAIDAEIKKRVKPPARASQKDKRRGRRRRKS